MMNQFWENNAGYLPMMNGANSFFGIPANVMILFALWALAWKGLALWNAARRGEKVWYVALLIVNTLGLFEIVYLVFFAKVFSKQERKK